MNNETLNSLISMIAKLPGLGPKSARRIVLHMINSKEYVMEPMGKLIAKAASSIVKCDECGNIDTTPTCAICLDSSRSHTLMCVVESVGDLWTIERCGQFNGIYHVIGGSISAIDNRMPESLNLSSILKRVNTFGVKEVILALKSNIEGQTTAHYIHDLLKDHHIKITRLANGIPIGGEIEYIDDNTLALAMKLRHEMV